ncbi:MAG: ADP-forming succinate--CoA ligase subunit beta [Candidatus Calescibacterium sp.]|nr:ADP-forming succinate--CoA ligase subunit beta [Candidatus Calescibacterium sp.]MCX7733894.1 ADP-forming succinate--CoA ligase subunit beta [bacterium]MDW8088031.1 ADP-forming succinate--CoA ligase subunit beta [Candidatus Calescibacterium sp.]
MNIHEYQAKNLLRQYGIPVPEGAVTKSAAKAKKIALKLGGDIFAVKAQIHAGGRGKAGGIQIARTPDEVQSKAAEMLKKKLVTYQTGPEGKKVRKILIEKGEKIKKEYYLGVVIDRSKEKISVIASTEGGVDIEEVAKKSPEKIFVEYLDPLWGIPDYKARKISKFLGIDATDIIKNLVRMFIEKDCSLCEINPLALTEDGKILALDAKINFDDNALFRHKDIQKLYDPYEDDPRDVKARKVGISYVGLDGDIGCLVNGAGLAMATMDEILLAGGKPANFLDVGGGASLEQVRSAFSILMSDKRVKVVFVNIFGGIMRCDTVANALVQVAKELKKKIPIVVRLEGTNYDLGMKIIQESGMDNISTASSIREGAELAVMKSKDFSIKPKRGRKRKEERI